MTDAPSTMPEPGRLAAHVLADAMTAFDGDNPESETNSAAMNLAFDRLNDVGAVTATQDDDTGELTIDLSMLLGGTLVAMKWLVRQASVYADVPQELVIAQLREFLDRPRA